METLAPTVEEEIQTPDLQSTDGPDSTEQSKTKNPEEAEVAAAEEEEEKEASKEEEKEASKEEAKRSNNMEITDEDDSVEKLKRKNREDEVAIGAGKHPLWKTSLCSYFRRHDRCRHGNACRYAHGEGELRPRPDNSWDPTSDRAKKLLKLDDGERIDGGFLDAREDVLSISDEIGDSSNGVLDKCIVHLPMKWDSEKLKNYLDDQGILYNTAKKKKGMVVGFVGFATTEQLKIAIEGLDGKSIGNKRLKVADVISKSREKRSQSAVSLDQGSVQAKESSSASEDPIVSGSLSVVEDENTIEKDNNMVEGSLPRTRSARNVATPLADMPYNDQLEYKKNSLLQTLKRLTRNARKACPDAVPLPEWILQSRDIGGLPCKLEGILESPLVNGYRNKCEFSIGYSRQGKRTVGFSIGNFREGVTAVEESVDCPNVSRISCNFASIFEDIIQLSGLPVWNRIDNTGFWRQFTVREGRRPDKGIEVQNVESCIAEVMLIIQICSVGVDEELMTSELQRMAKALADGASACSPPLPLTSLVVQDHKGISNAAPVDCPLLSLSIPKVESISGPENPNAVEARIHDYISNLRFCISPTAFFQVNTLAAEKLYSLAGDWADLGPDTLLFDICCGTGTIGLTLAHRVGMVVGIEMNASAVSDAHRNAEINGITNCRFVCAKAEDVMGALLKQYLIMPTEQIETFHVSDSSNEDTSGRENGAHDEKLPDFDTCESSIDTIETDGQASRMQEDSDGRDSSILADLSKENSNGNTDDSGNCLDHIKENKINTSIDHIIENNSRREDDPSQENCISEEKKVASPMPICQYKDVVAIVDPPRVGLHPVVIKALRTHPRLRRLVYISCNPESLVANAIEFCTPSVDKPEKGKNNRGWRNMSNTGLARHRAKSMPNSEPFQPVKAMAVDLFPHTPHCEMVMLLKR